MTERTTCAVVGGGPAGMVLGLLLARAGVDVTVLEKHGDFLELRADLTVAADGRWSIARAQAELQPEELPVPIDTWWFRLPREAADPTALTPVVSSGRFVLAIPREGFLQLAYFAAKGTDAQLRARGVEWFRQEIATAVPWLADRVHELASMDDVKHLDIRLNRLNRWHVDGLLCILDAAHAIFL